MKMFVFLVSFLSFGFAHADHTCTSTEGDTIVIQENADLGLGLTLTSPAASKFYREHINVDVESFESIIDPDTGKFLTEEKSYWFVFAVQAKANTEIGNMWSVRFAPPSKTTARALLMDMEGNGFDMHLTCDSTPVLEE